MASSSPGWPRSVVVLGAFTLSMVMWLVLSEGLTSTTIRIVKRSERTHLDDFTLPSLDGRAWTLSAQRGRVVLVNFWGATCGPCLAGMPALVAIAREFDNRDFQIVGIAMDEHPAVAVPAVVDRFHIPFPVITCFPMNENPNDTPNAGCHFNTTVESIPLTLALDRDGRIACTIDAVATERTFRTVVVQLLSEK